jgi:hypothetical protein
VLASGVSGAPSATGSAPTRAVKSGEAPGVVTSAWVMVYQHGNMSSAYGSMNYRTLKIGRRTSVFIGLGVLSHVGDGFHLKFISK